MTDAMGGGRGGVGIRLFTSGGEVVKRTFDQVGDSGKKMWAEIALGEKSANPALRAMSRLSGDAQKSMGDLGGRAGAAGNALGAFGTAGLIAAGALGAIVIAAVAVSGAMADATRSAADLTDTADRIGLGTEALQQWRYVADEAGVGIDVLQANMEKLNGVVGAFKLGIGDGKLKPIFEELGISKETLAGIESADQLMALLADTLGQVEDRASQVRLARGLGVEDSLPILRLGSERIRELADEAEHLGFVIDKETVKRLDDADRAMERAGQQMKVLRDTGVAPLAESFADATGYLAGLAVEFSNIESHAPRWIQTLMSLTRALPITGVAQRIGELLGAQVAPSPQARGTMLQDRADYNGVTLADMEDLLRAPRSPFAPLGHTSSGGSGGISVEARAAEQRRREAQREIDGLMRTDWALQRDLLKADADQVDTAQARAESARLLLHLDEEEARLARDKTRAAIEAGGLMTDEVRLQLENLDALREGLSARQRTAITETELRELAAERLATEKASDEDAIALMDLDLELARSAQERVEIARRILLAQHALELKVLEASLKADGKLSDADVAALDRKRTIQGREVDLFNQNQRDDLRDQFRSYGLEIVQAVEDGRLGEHIADQLKARLIDMALDGLFEIFNPRGGGGDSAGGGSIWRMAASAVGSLFGGGSGPGRAGGGSLMTGLRHPVVETGRPELLMIGGQGQVTGAAETARLLREATGAGGANGGRTVHEHHHHNKLDLRGAVMTEQLVAGFNAQTRASEARAVAKAVDIVSRGAAGRQARLARLGT